jgi:hypothetical protein
MESSGLAGGPRADIELPPALAQLAGNRVRHFAIVLLVVALETSVEQPRTRTIL